MNFSDILGHHDIIDTLRNLSDSGKVPHALLFAGIPGIGKFRTARAFAQYLHCKSPVNGEACGKCRSCLQHHKHNNPDLHFIYPIVKKDGALVSKDVINQWQEFLDNYSYMPQEKWNELIKAGNSQPAIFVNESAEILNKASISAFQENLKIFIIWQPEKMRVEAANKLLKIIEEPFEDTIFILVSNNAEKILPTILSRTQKFNFSPLSENEITGFLIKEGINEDIAKDAGRLSRGNLQRALDFSINPDELNEFSDLFKQMMRNSYALKAKELKSLSEDIAAFGREKIIRYLSYCQRLVRENFLFNYNIDNIIALSSDEAAFSSKFAPFIHEGNVEKILSEFERAEFDIERNGNSKIILFDLFLLLSRAVRSQKTNQFPD